MAANTRTSIPCSNETRDRLKTIKDKRGQDWDSFLLDLVRESNSNADNENELSYDDVREACKDAIQSELPVETMGGY